MMYFLALIYCVAVVGASLAGGSLPMIVRLTHTRMQIALSFVAGVMLGVGLLHLVPHGYFELSEAHGTDAIDRIVLWLVIGFLTMFFLERFFQFHHHDTSSEALETDILHAHDHCDHDHDHGHAHAHASHGLRFTWGGAAIGLTLHSLMDGVALAAALAADWQDGQGFALAGLGTFIAVFLHKPFDAMTISTLMAAGGWSTQARHLVNAFFAFVTPLGVALFFLCADTMGADRYHLLVGSALGFSAGAFLCIATSDLLPELQFHTHDRLKLSLALLLGLTLAWSIVLVEGAGHGHHHHEHSVSSD
jgi:zinc and cadmium transporter